MCSCVRIIFWFMCSCSFNFFLVSFLFSIHLISCLFCLSTSSVVYIFNDLTKSFMYWLSEWVTNCWQTLEILFYKSIIFLAYDKTTLSQLYYSTYIYIWSSGGCAQLFTVECSMNFYCYNKSHPSDSLLYIYSTAQHEPFPWFACFIQDNQCMFIHTYTTLQLCYTNRCSFWLFNSHCQFYQIFFSVLDCWFFVFWHDRIQKYAIERNTQCRCLNVCNVQLCAILKEMLHFFVNVEIVRLSV